MRIKARLPTDSSVALSIIEKMLKKSYEVILS